MSEQPEAADAALVRQLELAVYEREQVPTELVDFAVRAFAWRSIDIDLDAELAELIADSALVSEAVRGGALPRTLTFVVGASTLVLEITTPDQPGLRSLLGQFLGPATEQVVVDQPGSPSTPTAVDSRGHFSVSEVSAGPIRIRWKTDGSWASTSWLPST